MSNKETLLQHNTRLNINNVNMQEILNRVKSLPTMENLTEELTTYDNTLTTQETKLEDIVETLKTKTSAFKSKYAPRKISFYGYSGTELNEELTNLDMSKITDMSRMFYGCENLTDFDLSMFNTSNITNMNYTFGYCGSLTELNLSNFNTSKVTDMSYMFSDCVSLKEINVNNFNTSSVTTMKGMFIRCKVLTELDLSSFETHNVTDMGSMFRYCKFTKLDIRNFNFGKVSSYNLMFDGVPANCEIIVKDDAAKTWVLNARNDLSNVKTVAELEV